MLPQFKILEVLGPYRALTSITYRGLTWPFTSRGPLGPNFFCWLGPTYPPPKMCVCFTHVLCTHRGKMCMCTQKKMCTYTMCSAHKKQSVCAHVQLQYLSFATLGTTLHWKIAELLMFEVNVKNVTNGGRTI